MESSCFRRTFGNLQALDSLLLGENPLKDLTPLQGLPALRSVDCWGTQVSDLTPLQGLPALQSVNCAFTHVSDVKDRLKLPPQRSFQIPPSASGGRHENGSPVDRLTVGSGDPGGGADDPRGRGARDARAPRARRR